MAKRDDGGAAFPTHGLDVPLNDADNPKHRGMSLRDFFAGMALQGLCANSVMSFGMTQMKSDAITAGVEVQSFENLVQYPAYAQAAYAAADAMLKEREQ